VNKSVEMKDIVNQRNIRLAKEKLEWIATYYRNQVNLALPVLITMRKCHDAKHIHNDISTSNVLLHFDFGKVNTIYPGICD